MKAKLTDIRQLIKSIFIRFRLAFVVLLVAAGLLFYLNINLFAHDKYKEFLITGQDPSVVYRDGFYYLIQSHGDLIIRKSETLAGLKDAPATRVWENQCCNVWAPELQFIQGKWYIYYTKDDGDNDNHRMYVLESKGTDPLGPYADKGKISAPGEDFWAIDGNVIEKEDGSLYFIWSGWPGKKNGRQNLYIATMSNPYTISGGRVMISSPQYAWEEEGMPINEGPQPFRKNGRYFIVYSASGSWTDDYCLGIITNKTGDLMNPAAWTKSPEPVFTKTETAYGPGHHCMLEGPDGECWNIYHANTISGSGWDGRTLRMQNFTWNDLDLPVFGKPLPADSVVLKFKSLAPGRKSEIVVPVP